MLAVEFEEMRLMDSWSHVMIGVVNYQVKLDGKFENLVDGDGRATIVERDGDEADAITDRES